MQPAAIPKPTIHDVVAGPFWRRQWLTIFCSVILLAGTAAFMWAAFMSVPDTLGLPFALGAVALMLFILTCIIIAIWRRAYKRTAWYRYSIDVGGTYSFDIRPEADAFVFQRGAYRNITDQIAEPTQLPFSAFGNYRYDYYVRYNYSSLPLIPRKVSFFELSLPRSLPHIILDSKKNNLFRRYSEYGVEIESMQRLELEGDFIDYFSLYVPAGYQSDALYLFSPDIMQLMVQYAADYDIEIIDNKLYLFGPGDIDITDSAKLTRTTLIGMTLLQKFDKNAARYVDARIDSHDIDTIAPAGSRLKRRAFPIVAVLIILCLLGILYG